MTTVRGIARTLSTILTQAVEDELLPANPALRLGRYLRTADDAEPAIDPFTRDEVVELLRVARERLPDWYPCSCVACEPACGPGSCWRCNGAISIGGARSSRSVGISCELN